jgi:hypothetical protein
MATIPQIIALGRVTALLLVSGCALACERQFPYLGHWEGHRDLKGAPGTAPYIMNTLNVVKLWVHPNGRFDLQDMGMAKQGNISVQGQTAVLIITKIGGKDVETQPKEMRDNIAQINLKALGADKISYSDPKSGDPAPIELKRIATDESGRP